MDTKQPEPVIPANRNTPPKRVVRIADYRGAFTEFAASLRPRRRLTGVERTLVEFKPPEPIAHYVDTWKGLTETKGLPVIVPATPLLPDRRAVALRWVVARLGESSTYRGLFVLLGVIGWALTDQQSEALMALGMAFSAAIAIFFPDQPGAS